MQWQVIRQQKFQSTPAKWYEEMVNAAETRFDRQLRLCKPSVRRSLASKPRQHICIESYNEAALHRVFRQHVCIESYDKAVAQSPSRSRLRKTFRCHVCIGAYDDAFAQRFPTTCLH